MDLNPAFHHLREKSNLSKDYDKYIQRKLVMFNMMCYKRPLNNAFIDLKQCWAEWMITIIVSSIKTVVVSGRAIYLLFSGFVMRVQKFSDWRLLLMVPHYLNRSLFFFMWTCDVKSSKLDASFSTIIFRLSTYVYMSFGPAAFSFFVA